MFRYFLPSLPSKTLKVSDFSKTYSACWDNPKCLNSKKLTKVTLGVIHNFHLHYKAPKLVNVVLSNDEV